MQLPEELHGRRFTDWNYLVRGLMEIWELALLLGLERELERLVLEDRGGALTERLAVLGNDCSTLARELRQHVQARHGGTESALLLMLASISETRKAERRPGAAPLGLP